MSHLPTLMRQNEELMKLLKDNILPLVSQQQQQQQQQQDQQTNISAEISDLKRIVESHFLNRSNNSDRNDGSNADPNGSKANPTNVSFETITKKYFTQEILEFHFQKITKETCKLIRYVLIVVIYLLPNNIIIIDSSPCFMAKLGWYIKNQSQIVNCLRY